MDINDQFTLPISVENFLPHRKPILMINRILEVNDPEKSSIIEAIIDDNNLFVDNDGKLEPEALIEIMAQAAAAQHGYNLARENKKEEKGFLVGIKKFNFLQDVKKGDSLQIEVKLGTEIESLSMIHGKTFCNGNEIATIEFTVWHG